MKDWHLDGCRLLLSLTRDLSDIRNQKLFSLTTSHSLYIILSCSEPFSSEDYMLSVICTMKWLKEFTSKAKSCLHVLTQHYWDQLKNPVTYFIGNDETKKGVANTYMQPLNHPECANYSTFCWRKNLVTVGLMRCPFSPLRRYLNLFPEPRIYLLSKCFFGQLRKYFQTDNWIETICHILRGHPSWRDTEENEIKPESESEWTNSK